MSRRANAVAVALVVAGGAAVAFRASARPPAAPPAAPPAPPVGSAASPAAAAVASALAPETDPRAAAPVPPDDGADDDAPPPAASAAPPAAAPPAAASSAAPAAAGGPAAPPVAPAAPPHATAAAPAPVPAIAIAIVVRDGMVRVPGGPFTMGTSDPAAPYNERPAHRETVAPFWIDRTEVTVGAYRACVDARDCAAPPRSSTTCTFAVGDPSLPVSCVHWRDADAFCRHAGKRLPREAEWELAARGSSAARYPWGGGASCALAATLLHESTGRSCTGARPAPVGAHPAGASPFGALDMSGNLEEWTADWYADGVAHGAAPLAGAAHVLRGGGWLSAPSASRVTSRDWGSAMEAGPNVGFRCARDD